MKKFSDLSIVIVAGGTGSRMGLDVPKQFVQIQGQEILAHTIKALSTDIQAENYIVVCHAEYLEKEAVYKKLFPELNLIFIQGGHSRTASCKIGVENCPASGVIFVHDAARPFVNKELIERLYSKTKTDGNAIPVQTLKSSLRKIKVDSSEVVDRNLYREVQTPQAFMALDIQAAYAKSTEEYTDDASLMEAMGHQIHLVEGQDSNMKITTPMDLEIAKCLLAQNQI